MNNILDQKRENSCTSCGTCFAVCPKHAISFVKSIEGFYRPQIDFQLCVSCGICKKSCYMFDRAIRGDVKVDDYYAFGFKSNDKSMLKCSSSGGACFEIVKHLLSEGYSILGVAYSHDEQIAKGIIFNDIKEFHKIQGSKYFQADISTALAQCLNDKTSKYAIFGTPCQIYAIRKVICEHNAVDRFVLIDIFCHGAPTVELWQKYISYISEKYKKRGDIVEIDFRSKKKKWHRFCNTFHFSDGSEVTSKIIDDPFFTLFFSKDLFNDACYECKLRSTLAYTDIRIGDFWGARYDTDLEGVSCVVAITKKGKEICSHLSNVLDVVSFSEVIKAQSYGAVHVLHNSRRSELLEKMSDSQTLIIDILHLYKKKLSLQERAVKLKKDVIKLFPIRVSTFVKKIYHTHKYNL